MKRLKRYTILGIVNLAVLALFAYSRGIFNILDGEHVYHILSDDFFAVGVVNFSIGAILWAGNEGAFDMLFYGMRSFWGFFFKDLNKYVDYHDYKESKHSESFAFAHFLVYGVLFIALAYLFLKQYQLFS